MYAIAKTDTIEPNFFKIHLDIYIIFPMNFKTLLTYDSKILVDLQSFI